MKTENGYLVIEDSDCIKNKKITGTNIYTLMGKNKWTKKGDGLLARFGLYKEYFDPFYTKRGDIAEKVLNKELQKYGYAIKTWNKYEIHFDNFPNDKKYGGMLDIAIIEPYRCVVECKSKNISKLDEVKKFRNFDYETQATFYGYMAKCEKVKLIYVFFTDEQEDKIKKDIPLDLNEEKFEFYTYDLEFDEKEVESNLKQCYEYKEKCFKERRIPLEDISEKVLNCVLKNGG